MLNLSAHATPLHVFLPLSVSLSRGHNAAGNLRENGEMKRIPLQSLSRFELRIHTRHITVRLDVVIPVALLVYLLWVGR